MEDKIPCVQRPRRAPPLWGDSPPHVSPSSRSLSPLAGPRLPLEAKLCLPAPSQFQQGEFTFFPPLHDCPRWKNCLVSLIISRILLQVPEPLTGGRNLAGEPEGSPRHRAPIKYKNAIGEKYYPMRGAGKQIYVHVE